MPREDCIIPVLQSYNGSTFTCGFYSQASLYPELYYFAILVVPTDLRSININSDNVAPMVVWSANWTHPVGNQATLELTVEGDLILKDADGSVAWSTQTCGESVVGMKLTDTGNLVLFDKNNAVVWQSIDHPTDTLLLGQKLRVGQKLTPSNIATNMNEQGLYSLSLTTEGLFAQVETDPPQVYYASRINFPDTSSGSNYVEFTQGHLELFLNYTRNGSLFSGYVSTAAVQFLKFESDGHLRVCPDHYFRPIDYANPSLGCTGSIPSSCEALQLESFLDVRGVSYFAVKTDPQGVADLGNLDEESCKKTCANNCSCRAALFQDVRDGSKHSRVCYLLSQVFSIKNESDLMHSTVLFLKVHKTTIEVAHSSKTILIKTITSSLGSLLAVVFLVAVIKGLYRRKGFEDVKEEKGVDEVEEVEEDYLDQVSGALMRFTYDDLKIITEDFDNRIAVKQLNGSKKSFLAEVESIGNIHHVNLVRLIGFCAEKFHRLLVYEYIAKGSLNKWIFHKLDESSLLDWQQRMKIIFDIAKGLCYLHEECRWKIVHMDIKPQNILLDENFNAKIADFGLSKIIDRDQSQIVTTMRGTPGYMAPEWLHATITEKVDVYSFGVVILEIVCGRKVFDRSQNQEDMYLLGVFKRKWEEGRLLDMIDKRSEDMQLNRPHVMKMMRLAAWCLQVDFTKRPSLSMAIKVLEGVMEVPGDLDYNFSYLTLTNGISFLHNMILLVCLTTL
ncbi:hypothetical protein EUGRSUZ_K01410 [Eucalyptus grandis]|uniref:Receptor-like serine/threonine-protein kinase n=2 Tax=Eucalyptus grandis TaxID=71139 RepID=A0A059A1V7_EUCGR|nr:hypothetical protein EUGRSUZ_K01410 [Eucalyptus grandis]